MDGKLTRRRFLVRTAVPAMVLGMQGPQVLSAAQAAAARPLIRRGPRPVEVALIVNGTQHRLEIEPRVTLLDALRERLGLTGTKKGCDQGTCGACTVLVDGRRIVSCLSIAVQNEGKHVTTIEGLAQGETLHPVQAAFIAHDGFQCGYCTPGQICSAVGFLAERRPTDPHSVREWMSGNICRCGAYPNIVAAIRAAAGATA
jgi:xanthine dehydrogenase YagT iron-sulfur-binding subunit